MAAEKVQNAQVGERALAVTIFSTDALIARDALE
jgi:hypothetical protein